MNQGERKNKSSLKSSSSSARDTSTESEGIVNDLQQNLAPNLNGNSVNVKNASAPTMEVDLQIKAKPTIKYNSKDQGPYIVMCKSLNVENGINQHGVVKLIKDNGIDLRKVQRVEKVNKSMVKVKVDDGKTANAIVEIKSKDFTCEIPATAIYRTIVVFGVPGYLNVAEMEGMVEVREATEIKSIERVNRWNREEQKEVPANIIKVTYRGQNIAREVSVFKVVHKSDVFVFKPKFCGNCKRFGHTKKYCRGDKYEGHECRYCQTNEHHTGNRMCPETQRQWKIGKIMVMKRVSWKEAEKMSMEDIQFPTVSSSHKNPAQQRLMEWKNPDAPCNMQTKINVQVRVIEELKSDFNKQKKFIDNIMEVFKKMIPEDQFRVFEQDYKNILNK